MIEVQDFKDYFTRDFPYLPTPIEDKAYFQNDVVYVEPNFYQSLVNGNLFPVTDTMRWEFYNDSTENYLSDEDIQKAIDEALLAYPVELFGEETKIPLLYLTAYYLVVDIKNSSVGLSSNGYSTFVSSKAVGSVSESYGLPAWVNSDPMMSMYLDNGYGKKYLTYLLPATRTASIGIISRGASTI